MACCKRCKNKSMKKLRKNFKSSKGLKRKYLKRK